MHQEASGWLASRGAQVPGSAVELPEGVQLCPGIKGQQVRLSYC